MYEYRYTTIWQAIDYDMAEREKQKSKKKKFRARHKASNAAAWMLENEPQRRWRGKKERFDKERELEIKEAELLANQKREEHARALEEKARQIRTKCNHVVSTDEDFIDICTNRDAGTLNLSSTCSTSSIDTHQKVDNIGIWQNGTIEDFK